MTKGDQPLASIDAGDYPFPFGLFESTGSGIRRKSRLMPATSIRVGTFCNGDLVLPGVIMTLPEGTLSFSTDDRCRELLERLRWPEGVMCPRCKDSRVSRLKHCARFECVGCQYQFTVTSGENIEARIKLRGISAIEFVRRWRRRKKNMMYGTIEMDETFVGGRQKSTAGHAGRLEEMTFRFNRRGRADLFIDILRHMITADPLTFEKLTA